MADIQIPPEVVEIVARALCIAEDHDPDRLRRLSEEKMWTVWIDEARALTVAVLAAWPGKRHDKLDGHVRQFLILPLPQETNNE